MSLYFIDPENIHSQAIFAKNVKELFALQKISYREKESSQKIKEKERWAQVLNYIELRINLFLTK